MTHRIKKPFHDAEQGRIVQPGEKFDPADKSRLPELESAGLVEKGRATAAPPEPPAAPDASKHNVAAPSNKDAAGKRKTK